MRLIEAMDLWLTAVRWSAWSAAATAAAAAALSVAWRVTRRNVLARRDRRRERYRAFFEGLLSDQAPPASIIDGPRRVMDGVFLGLLADALDRADAASRPRLLALCERSGYVARFRGAAWSPLWWRRAHAARWLGRLGSPESVSDLIRLLDDSSYHVRCVAVGALASWRHPRILSALLKTLDHMRERTPWGALPRRHRVPIGVVTDALIAQGASAVAPLLPRLQSGPRPVREAVAEVLSWSPDPHPRVRAALLGALRDDDPEVRARAAKALGKIAYVGAVVPLADTLSDGTWFVRLQAARALGAIAHPRAIAPLVSALTDEYWQVRAAAADALRRLGDLAVPALTHCLFTSRDRYAKEQIVEELQRTSFIQEQIDALDEARPGAGFAAQRLLREIARHGATRILLEALRRHPTPAVRLRLIDILEGHGSHQVVAALHDVMNGDADAGVREAACRALTTGGRDPAGRNTAQGRAA